MPKEKVQISFTETQLIGLRNESKRLGSSLASIVRLAVSKYFEGEK